MIQRAYTFFRSVIIFPLEFPVILCKVKGGEDSDFQRIGRVGTFRNFAHAGIDFVG